MPVKIICDSCGETFEVQPYRAEEARFCSHECRAEWQSDAYQGENGPNYRGGKDTFECRSCGDEILEYESQAGTDFCDMGCYGKWLSEHNRRENHPLFEGGLSQYDGTLTVSEWAEISEKIRERDSYECTKCGMTNEEHNDELGKSLDVHHKKRPKEFENPNDANEPENLVTMCAYCHGEEES